MKIPSVISRSVLQTLAAPGETHAVRVILHEVNNPGQFRLRTTRRQYIFERDGNLGVHALTIPASCWMEGTLPGRFRDNPSISQDFRTAGDVKWSIQIVPWGTATAAAPDNSKECLALLRKLLSNIGAPEEVESAFQFIESGNMASLRSLWRCLPRNPHLNLCRNSPPASSAPKRCAKPRRPRKPNSNPHDR